MWWSLKQESLDFSREECQYNNIKDNVAKRIATYQKNK